MSSSSNHHQIPQSHQHQNVDADETNNNDNTQRTTTTEGMNNNNAASTCLSISSNNNNHITTKKRSKTKQKQMIKPNNNDSDENNNNSVEDCESQLHQAVVDAILRSPLGTNSFSQVSEYLLRQQQQEREKDLIHHQASSSSSSTTTKPKYFNDAKSLFDALNPKYSVVTFASIAKILSLAAVNYRCDESDARDLALRALRRASHHHHRDRENENSNNNDYKDGQGGNANGSYSFRSDSSIFNKNNNFEDDDDSSNIALANGGVNFQQFCAIGESLRDNMMEAAAFGCQMSEHDKCISLQHKIMETISAKKLQEKQQAATNNNNTNNNNYSRNAHSSSSRNSPKRSSSSSSGKKSNNNNTKIHKLQWFEIAFLKEAHTKSLLTRPDTDKLTSSYRQAPLFKSPNNHNSLVLVPTTNNSNNNDDAVDRGVPRRSPSSVDHHHQHQNQNNNNNNNNTSYMSVSTYRPPPQEKKLPRSTARSTIAPFYDADKARNRIISPKANVTHVYSTRGRREMMKNRLKKGALEAHAEEDDLLLRRLGDSLM